MRVCDLIDLLNTFPSYLDVWVSDAGYAEGGTPLMSVEEISAYSANLDGDEIGDEWITEDDGITEDPCNMSKEGYVHHHPNEYGDVYSKSIVLIKSLLDQGY